MTICVPTPSRVKLKTLQERERKQKYRSLNYDSGAITMFFTLAARGLSRVKGFLFCKPSK